MEETGLNHDLSLIHCLDICYAQKVENKHLLVQAVADSGLVQDLEALKRQFS